MAPLYADVRALLLTLGSLSNNDGDGNENGEKPIGLDCGQNNNSARASRSFVHFFAVFARFARFVEDRNTKQQFSFPFSELWDNPLEFKSKEICQHLSN